MRIGILQTGHAAPEVLKRHGDYDAMFHRLFDGHGFDFFTVSVVDSEPLPALEDADGWLITGSRHGAYEDHDWIPPLEDFIRAAHAAKRPMVGICFGHQIIAQALGGRVEKFEGGWSVGPQRYDFEGEALTFNAWHQDQVTERPEGARVLAQSAFCENAALAYGDHIYTVQPHPEFDDAIMDGLIQYRGPGVVPDPLLTDAGDKVGTPLDNSTMAARMATFLKAHAEAGA